jgi:opacity protein-like surface antigen
VFRIIIFLGLLLSSSVFGETVSMTASNTDLLIGLSIGSTWVSGNKTQTINLEPDVVKTYTASQTNNVIPSFELFVGGQKPIVTTQLMPYTFLGQLGLSVAEAGNANLTGDIWEDADPNFDNFNYKYKVNHVHVGVKGRLMGDCGHFVEPYISGSIGVGFNRAYGFTITPKISEEVAAPAFASNTTTAFSYTLGIGLQKTFKNLQVAIGYEFSDWGRSSLSLAAGQTTIQTPKLNHLYAQTLQLSLFYV